LRSRLNRLHKQHRTGQVPWPTREGSFSFSVSLGKNELNRLPGTATLPVSVGRQCLTLTWGGQSIYMYS
jgi:hypothetical protein